MKKIIFCISIFLLFSQIKAKAQDKNEILNILLENTENTYLKDLKVKLKPQSFTEFSIVFSKNTTYQISFFPDNNIMVNLYKNKSNKSLIPKHSKIENNIITNEYDINETAVYTIEVKNKTNDAIICGVLISFVKKFNQTESQEKGVAITSQGSSKKEKNSSLKEKSKPSIEEIFFVVEEMPKFRYKEGDKIFTDFNDYIKYKINYPPEAKEQKIEGRVYVQFTVNKEGYIQDANIMRGAHPALNQEALRIIYSSPRWKPGTQRGHKVNVSFTFPVVFKLNNQ